VSSKISEFCHLDEREGIYIVFKMKEDFMQAKMYLLIYLSIKMSGTSQLWWHTLVIQTQRRLRQED
jgi:hypothetical protein